MRKIRWLILSGALLLAGPRTLQAAPVLQPCPVLQLYVEGGYYDVATHSWAIVLPRSSDGVSFRVWAIGNVSGPGSRGPIEDVRLAVGYQEEDLGLVISLKPVQVGGEDLGRFPRFVDPSVPPVPVPETVSLLWPANGSSAPGSIRQEFALGDFVLSDSPIGDFCGRFPTDVTPRAGQINVYEVSIFGGKGAELHLRLYGTTGAKAGEVVRHASQPEVQVFLAPEPSAVFVWFLLGFTFAGAAWMYQYFEKWRELERARWLAPVPALWRLDVPRAIPKPSRGATWRLGGRLGPADLESPSRDEGP